MGEGFDPRVFRHFEVSDLLITDEKKLGKIVQYLDNTHAMSDKPVKKKPPQNKKPKKPKPVNNKPQPKSKSRADSACPHRAQVHLQEKVCLLPKWKSRP